MSQTVNPFEKIAIKFQIIHIYLYNLLSNVVSKFICMYVYIYVLFTKVIYTYYKNVNITEVCNDDSNHPL